MRKIVNIGLQVFAICICCVITGQTPENDCTKDVKDKRGIMRPWEKGAWETGKYRSVNPRTGRHNAEGSASDDELYFVTDLLFASNRWGNNTGIDYYAEARRILDAMWIKDGSNGQMHADAVGGSDQAEDCAAARLLQSGDLVSSSFQKGRGG
jgi:hypothetical protein